MTENATSNTAPHDQMHRALVDRLAADLQPIRPLWPVRIRIGFWLALEMAILVWAATIHSGRQNLLDQFKSPLYLAEFCTFIGDLN